MKLSASSEMFLIKLMHISLTCKCINVTTTTKMALYITIGGTKTQ